MKILTVRSSMPANGPSTQSLTIAKTMKSNGHELEFVTSGGAYSETVRESGFVVHIVPGLAHNRRDPLNVGRAIFSLSSVIRTFRPDVIHGHNAAATVCSVLAGYLAGRRVPCVTSVRGVEERSTHQWRNRVWKRTPGLLLGVCEKTRDRLLSFGVQPEKIRVTYNGADLKRFNPFLYDGEAQKEILGLADKIVVGSTGAMTGPENLEGPSKGQHVLIRAVAKLSEKHDNLAILFVGDGPRRGQLERMAKEYGISDNVVFAGQRWDVPEMLSAMDIYCLPSIWGEFFPNSIIEAMAMKKPWIGSDIAGLSELTANNRAGWVTPPGDVNALASNLEKLLFDRNERDFRGLAAREEVEEKFSSDKVCQAIMGAYREALAYS